MTPGGGVFYYEKLERKWYSADICVSPLALRDLVLRVGDQSGSEDDPWRTAAEAGTRMI